ncbi:MAG: hypothetical protein FJX46_15765 [Alphaproteobacteria bacterium]|nr:hypothetical protein [Alphaproteobacteria bacterium]
MANESDGHFWQIVMLLAASIVMVLAVHRFRASPVLGFLLTGIVIGPHGLGLIRQTPEIATLSELGVAFLLFLIGLELSFERLRSLRVLVFGLGAAQVAISAAAIGAIAFAWENGPGVSMVLGLCFALSSTALVVQLLVERGEIASRLGRVCFSVLLFQDLVVVPLLVLVTLLGESTDSVLATAAVAFGRAVLAIILILVIGRYALRLPYRWVAATGSPELFMALTLLIILATAGATHAAGLSLALGAFLAGLLLAETAYRHQIEVDIKPFKGLLLGLFFITVGLGIDLPAVAAQTGWIVASVIGLIAIKATIAAALCLAFGQPRDVAVRAGLLLAEGGEFAFVVIAAAMTIDVIPSYVGTFMFAVTGLSMLTTPLLASLGPRLSSWLDRRWPPLARAAPDASQAQEGHVVIAGFGRVGQTIAKLLEAQSVPYVAIDLRPEHVAQARARGQSVHFGDASRREILESLGVANAAAMIVTLDDPAAGARSLQTARELRADLKVFVRAHDTSHLADLTALGADGVVPETFESSLSLARLALESLGTPEEAATRLVDDARQRLHADRTGTPAPPDPQKPVSR